MKSEHQNIFLAGFLQYNFDWGCFYYFVRNSLVALLEALCARIFFFRFVNIGFVLTFFFFCVCKVSNKAFLPPLPTRLLCLVVAIPLVCWLYMCACVCVPLYSLETRWLGGSFLMVYTNNAGRLGSGFISVCLESRWLGQKSGFYVPDQYCRTPCRIMKSWISLSPKSCSNLMCLLAASWFSCATAPAGKGIGDSESRINWQIHLPLASSSLSLSVITALARASACPLQRLHSRVHRHPRYQHQSKRWDDEPKDPERRCDTMLDLVSAGRYCDTTTEAEATEPETAPVAILGDCKGLPTPPCTKAIDNDTTDRTAGSRRACSRISLLTDERCQQRSGRGDQPTVVNQGEGK